eukprot:m.144368 g.144368  ORF g.144368 m.144368 type:complete len:214 (-) comp52660_c0_seq1:23-664(-)
MSESNSIERFGVTQRFSDSVVHNNVVYLVEVPPDTSKDITGQTSDLLAAIDRLLTQAGSARTRILMATIYLRDMADYDGMNSVWDSWLPAGQAPARACVQVHVPPLPLFCFYLGLCISRKRAQISSISASVLTGRAGARRVPRGDRADGCAFVAADCAGAVRSSRSLSLTCEPRVWWALTLAQAELTAEAPRHGVDTNICFDFLEICGCCRGE